MGKEISQEVEEFKQETIKMLDEWTPKEFADELYGNPQLNNESRFIIQSYLSKKPELKKEVENIKKDHFSDTYIKHITNSLVGACED